MTRGVVFSIMKTPMLQKSSVAILITVLAVLLLFLGLLLWLRTLKSQESLEAVNDIILDVRQAFGHKKWQGYDISETARILEETENYYDVNNFSKSAELLESASTVLKQAELKYPQHTKALAINPPYGNFLYIPWSSYTPSQEEIIWSAERYDLFVLHMNRANFIPDIRATNPDAKIYLYVDVPIQQDEDLSDGGIGQFDWITANHPEWFLKDASERPVFSQEEYGYYWLDPGNKEWQEFYVQKIAEKMALSKERWDGVFLDNIRYTLDNTEYGTPVIASYATDEDFQEATLAFMRAIVDAMHQEKLNVIGNVSQVNDPNHPFWGAFLNVADGAMNEVFTRTHYNIIEQGYHTAAVWQQQLEQGQNIPEGKILLLENRVPFWSDHDISLYGYASMLLGINNKARPTYYYGREDTASIPSYWYDEYNVDMGEPTASAEEEGGIYSRAFERGLVIVNPNPNRQQITLTREMFNVSTNERTSQILLSAHSAVILLNP